jgi:hypothetical protein
MSGRAAGGLPHRRHGIPARAVLVAACAVLLCAAVLTGCTAVVPAAVHSAPAASAGWRPPTPSTGPAAGTLRTACGDDLHDGAGLDLAGVVLARRADELVAVFTLTSPPDKGASLLAVELRRADGTPLRRLTTELDRGQPVAASVTWSPTNAQRLDGAVRMAGAEVHAAYPAAVLDGLGSGWSWVASAGSSTAVDDLCPGDAAGQGPPVVVP